MKCARMLAVSGLMLAMAGSVAAEEFRSHWPEKARRPWAGPEYWANPMQDWRLRDGRVECAISGGNRNFALLTHEALDTPGDLNVSVRLGRLEEDHAPMVEGFVGLRVGIKGQFHDYRDSAVRGIGLNVGMAADGRLFIGTVEAGAPALQAPFEDIELRLSARPDGANYRLTLNAFGRDGRKLGEVVLGGVKPDQLTGGFALVCSSIGGPGTPRVRMQRGGAVRFWFRDWKVGGSKVKGHVERTFGPILWAMHTLNRGVMKLTAQMAPVDNENLEVLLQTQGNGTQWKTIAKTVIDPLSRTAPFRVAGWDDTRDTRYRVSYRMAGPDGVMRDYYYGGTIRKDPKTKPEIVAATFGCNNDLGFPHADVVRNVAHFNPDLLVFTGDQIYEGVGGYGIERTPVETATLDYLRKWYLFGWEYRELLKDRPAVCLPDDHDLYQGNIWGAGGKRAEGKGNAAQDSGGYVMHPDWVNTVQRTQTSHMPDPYDPTPVEQGITVFYTGFVYGGVSFAVVEDRKWKSSPAVMLPKWKIDNGWAQNPDYIPSRDGDAPGAQFLGKRQIDFLKAWAADWSGGAWIKAVISQTPWADVVTLPKDQMADKFVETQRLLPPGQYPPDEVPIADHDSGGWPQSGRLEAIKAVRQGLAMHIAGDQHLGMTFQYGIENWNDGPYAFGLPAVANVFPRHWFPGPGRNQKSGQPRYTGEYADAYGNKVTVHAVSNPALYGVEPGALHNLATGYTFVTFNRATRKITMANWPRWVDPSKPGARQFTGWPITIDQLDNGLTRAKWALEAVAAPGVLDPIVQVIDQSNGESVYTVRIKGTSFTPKVFREGTYTVKVSGAKGYAKTYPNQRAARVAEN